MNISLLISNLGRGGTERQLIRLARGLHARGNSVEVWCYGGSSPLDHELTEYGIRVRTGSGGNQRQKLRLIRNWIAEFQPDVMHGFMKRASSLAVLASRGRVGSWRWAVGGKKAEVSSGQWAGGREEVEVCIAALTADCQPPTTNRSPSTADDHLPAADRSPPTANRPRVIGSDLSTATYAPWKPSLWFSLVLFGFADMTVTQTELNRRSLERLAPWLKGKTRVIRNGLDLSRFKPRRRDMGYGIYAPQAGLDMGEEKVEVERRTPNVELRREDGANGDGSADLRIGRGEGGKDEGKANVELRTSNVEHRIEEPPHIQRQRSAYPISSDEGANIQRQSRAYPISSDEGAHIPYPATKECISSGEAAPFRFAVVGSVYSVKNPVRLVQAVKILKDQKVSDFRVEWYGRLGLGKEAESGSAEYHEAAALIREHGIEEFFCFKGETGEVHKILPDCDALIHPSLQEGFPNAVVEAMACGLPLVVSRVSDLPLVVESAHNGFVVDERDPAKIAEGMRRLMETDEEERREMGKRSRKLAEEWFGMERFVEEYIQLYQNLCD